MSIVERGSLPPATSNIDPFRHASVQAEPRWLKATWFGYVILFLFFIVLGGWAAMAPLSSAIIAPGNLIVDSQIKQIQHPDGGIISEIFVRDGDLVEQGQVLARLESKETLAQESLMRSKLVEQQIIRSRWQAELVGKTVLPLPKALESERTEPAIAAVIKEQEKLLVARREAIDRRISLQLSTMDQLEIEIKSMQDQLLSRQRQKSLIEKELEDVFTLFNKGLERKSRLRALERAAVALDGQISQMRGAIARGHERINSTQLTIISVQKSSEAEALEWVTKLDRSIRELKQRLPIIEERLRRLDIVAPRSGRIFGSAVNTIGGFVRRGAVIMQLVPKDDELVVEARVQQRDIDNLADVENVQVRLTSFNQRFTHPIKAKLVSVSDAVIEGQGPPHYRAIIHLDKESLNNIIPNARLRSGMPATSLIGVGQQSLLFYLVEPLFLSFYLALREPS